MQNTILSTAPSPCAPATRPTTRGPGRLLAVRVAGAAFNSPYNLRSPRLAALLEERASLRAHIAAARNVLTDALHVAVPHAPDRDTRRRLIALKRDVFNGRPPGDAPAGMPPVVAAQLARYACLAEEEATLLDRGRAGVLEEVRVGIEHLLEDPRFRLACFHSSPDLREQLENALPSGRAEPSSLERGLHSYAAKFVSKASPFHTFGSLLFPPDVPLRSDGAHEVVVDGGVILGLERRALTRVRDPRRVRVHLRTFTEEGEAFRFWVPSSEGFRVVALRAAPLVRALVERLREAGQLTGSPTLTRAECEAHLRAVLPADSRDGVAALLDRLVELGALAEYLITDFARFAPALYGADEELDNTAARMQRHHLARVPTSALPGIHAELEGGGGVKGSAPIWVNSYSDADPAPHLAATERVLGDLHELAPCFAAEHNFSAVDYVASAFLRDLLGGVPGAAAPYLEVLRHFLRGRDEVMARYHPDVHRPTAQRATRATWFAAAAAYTGVLERGDLHELNAGAPGPRPRPDLCFNGPFDYAEEVLYVSNVFAGRGRFAARYLLHRGAEPQASRPAGRGVVDVELALAPHPNINYVVRRFPTGCGFEARYSHRYERWVDPSEVIVALENGCVVYRHASTREELRFHHSGFLLGQLLGAEHQLLLAGHADSFRNPFVGATLPGSGDEVSFKPGLRYGAVILRRDRWVFRRNALNGLLRETDPLRLTALLRDWVHERVSPADEWYYRMARSATRGQKPLYLDLLNPLSVLAFRRELAAAPGAAPVSLSLAAPAPEGMARHGGAPYVTELMIEV